MIARQIPRSMNPQMLAGDEHHFERIEINAVLQAA